MEKILENAPEKLRKAVEKEQREEKEAVKAFNIEDFICDADEIKTVTVPELGLKVKYKRLTVNDLSKIQSKDSIEQSLYMLYLMLNKADSSVTYEKVCKMSPDVASKILLALTASFLSPTK